MSFMKSSGFHQGKANSTMEADKHRIWAEIADSGIRQLIKNVGATRIFSEKLIPDTDFEREFNRHMHALLSTSLLQHLMNSYEYEAAAECCLHGAQVTEEQLDEICQNFQSEDQRMRWLTLFLVETAKRGNSSLAEWLLAHGARPGIRTSTLIWAAAGGHEGVVKLLLEHGVDTGITDRNGATALNGAAAFGHEEVVKLLLEHGADAGVADNNGSTAIISASTQGHEGVVKLLLEHGVDAGVATKNGSTAIICASSGGHEAVVRRLLEHGVDAEVATNNGWTAMMFAAAEGHEALVKLLLEHGVDQSVAARGITPLMYDCWHVEPGLRL